MKSVLLIALFVASFSSYASLSSGGVSSSPARLQVQNEFFAQQDWIVDNLWIDFNVKVTLRDYSGETMRELRAMHDAFKNNQPVAQESYKHIIIVDCCRRSSCGC